MTPLKEPVSEEACSSADEHDFDSPLAASPKEPFEHHDEFQDTRETFDDPEQEPGAELKPAAKNINPHLNEACRVAEEAEASSDVKATDNQSGPDEADLPPPPPRPAEAAQVGNVQENEEEELSEEEAKCLEKAEKRKLEGNALFKEDKWQESLAAYREAIELAPTKAAKEIATYYCNAGMANIKLRDWQTAVKDTTTCLRLQPKPEIRIKALARRAQAYEALGESVRAFEDHNMIVNQAKADSPTVKDSREKMKVLKPIVDAEQEKTKEEMIGKLKELGNTVLGKFGMSLDNFKAVKDPATGQYSISMQN